MARQALTLKVDEKLLVAARAVAERAGVPVDELYARALRDVLARGFAGLLQDITADQAKRGATLTDEQGLALAYGELRVVRAERLST